MLEIEVYLQFAFYTRAIHARIVQIILCVYTNSLRRKIQKKKREKKQSYTYLPIYKSVSRCA